MPVMPTWIHREFYQSSLASVQTSNQQTTNFVFPNIFLSLTIIFKPKMVIWRVKSLAHLKKWVLGSVCYVVPQKKYSPIVGLRAMRLLKPRLLLLYFTSKRCKKMWVAFIRNGFVGILNSGAQLTRQV